jgi:ribonuclease D
MDIDYQIIDTDAGLKKITNALKRERNIAIDLEADSMYHFKEKVCLVQMATDKRIIIIDPIQVKDLSPLKPLFSSRKIRKIFHGADYDIRSLYRDFNIEINNLFDTETACRFLGFKETGLETVIDQYFNINLDKKYQKKDWSKRPLPKQMIEYAAIDVIYLIPLAEILTKELARIDRLSWVSEECELLCSVRPVLSDNEPLFMKFKGAGHLKPRNLAVLEALLRFRKNVAQKKDRPLFKIIGNNALMKIATEKPVKLKHLKRSKVLSSKQVNIWGNKIVEVVAQALSLPENRLPVYPRKKAPVLPPSVPRRVKALKRWRDQRASELEIDPGLLCNNALISTIAIANPTEKKGLDNIQDMKHWQRAEFGNDVVMVLRSMS